MTMMITEPDRTAEVRGSTLWVEVEPGFWAGNRTGEFVGTIESHRAGFIAFDSTHRALGTFSSFVAAREAVTGERWADAALRR